MGEFLTEISLINKKDLQGSYKRRKINEEVSQEKCFTLVATLNIIEKFIHQESCWKLLYSRVISKEDGQSFMRNLVELSDHYFVYKQILRLLQVIFEKLESTGVKYKENAEINSLVDDLSLRLPRMFDLMDQDPVSGDKLINLLVFVALHISSQSTEETGEKLQKMFDKCSFIGRKVMINLNLNQYKLILVLKFFVSVLSAIEDKKIVQLITKQILLLVYRTYTNAKLNKSEAKTISVEIIEILQKK